MCLRSFCYEEMCRVVSLRSFCHCKKSYIMLICEDLSDKNRGICARLAHRQKISIFQKLCVISFCQNTAVLYLLDEIHQAFDSTKSFEVRTVFLDISKAFDKVWHDGLIFKLEQNGISGNLLKLDQNYLINRKQRVVVQNGSYLIPIILVLNQVCLKALFLVLYYSLFTLMILREI